MRTLATVQRIKEVQNIEGKDRIKYLSFHGVDWKVIGGNEFKPNDLVVYIETDSILPEKPEFEFLRSRCYSEKARGFRIKCMKMAGLFSEGIVFPMTILPVGNWKEGDNVTTKLGITKYDDYDVEEPTKKVSNFKRFLYKFALFRAFMKLVRGKKSEKGWPSFLAKTDETRVQVLSYVYEALAGVPIYITTKMDGQSASFAYYKKLFYICSRNVKLEATANGKYKSSSKYHETASKFKIREILMEHYKKTGEWLTIQGEQCGPSIQGNKMGFNGLKFFVFNVFSISEKRYYDFGELQAFCLANSLDMVPVEASGIPFIYTNAEELLELSKGMYENGTPREGIVIRSMVSAPPQKGMANMVSFKVINPDFSLKYGL
jgi:hypothetical protein